MDGSRNQQLKNLVAIPFYYFLREEVCNDGLMMEEQNVLYWPCILSRETIHLYWTSEMIYLRPLVTEVLLQEVKQEEIARFDEVGQSKPDILNVTRAMEPGRQKQAFDLSTSCGEELYNCYKLSVTEWLSLVFPNTSPPKRPKRRLAKHRTTTEVPSQYQKFHYNLWIKLEEKGGVDYKGYVQLYFHHLEPEEKREYLLACMKPRRGQNVRVGLEPLICKNITGFHYSLNSKDYTDHTWNDNDPPEDRILLTAKEFYALFSIKSRKMRTKLAKAKREELLKQQQQEKGSDSKTNTFWFEVTVAKENKTYK